MRIPKGSQFMLVSIFFVSLVSVGVKFIHRLSIYEIVFYKSAVALVITIGALLHQQIPIWGKSKIADLILLLKVIL